MSSRESLERRNGLWRRLRALAPAEPSSGGSVAPGPDFEAVLAELSAMTGWDRGRVLLGLGLSDPEPLTGTDRT
ncbi:hypothetical protein [Deinococcus aerophilus]|uniref:Uncharacterized protein n=1 Tax=Deinococcus aerophilus TaxID=522488 RepID=A0ABQ2GM52_9DEIO|nr:hypothetical protein [Deinococcus aerophilus]GGM03246.1 hypothetical protein GCM10010841_09600 [Deinococcus aerophilus]